MVTSKNIRAFAIGALLATATIGLAGCSALADSSEESEFEISDDFDAAESKAQALALEDHLCADMVRENLQQTVVDGTVLSDGFTDEAIDRAMRTFDDVDWNENALELARGYVEIEMPLQQVHEQLTGYAEKCPAENADHAIANLG